jgi:hypothetical protein
MAALIALGIAVLALVLSGAVAWAVAAWRRDRRSADALAARLQADSRIEELTAQTLAAMREAARRYRRP